MSYADAMGTLTTHLRAAGSAVTPIITDVRRGWPPLQPTRCIAVWYEGDGDPALFPPSALNDEHIGEKLQIGVFWPLSDFNASSAEYIDVAIQSTNRAIQSRLQADNTLGEQCAGLVIGDSSVDPVDIGGQAVARLLIPVTLDFTDIEPKAR